MKKNNRAYAIGWVALVVAVIAAIVLGQVRKPQGGKYVVDDAGILSAKTEQAIGRYNAQWLDRWGGVTAVVTVRSADDIEDVAYDWADRLDLNDSCIILVISAGDGESISVWGYDLDSVMDASTVAKLTAVTDRMTLTKDYDEGVLDFFRLLDSQVYTAGLSTGYAGGGASAAVDAGAVVFLVVLFAVVLLVVLIAIEQSRFTAYRQMYYGVPGAPVFRPIFFWHVPGSVWYRRNWRPAPPPPPRSPRTPSGGGSFFGGSSHSSGGFHSSGSFRAGGSSRSGGGFRAGGSFRSGGGFRAGGSSRSGGGFRGRR